MTTTTRKDDYLGRSLVNATPGTSQAVDTLGRNVQTGDLDYLGRNLTDKPWAASTATSVGTLVYLSGGQELTCTTAGTTGATAPTAPGSVGGTVTDGSVTWTRTK